MEVLCMVLIFFILVIFSKDIMWVIREIMCEYKYTRYIVNFVDWAFSRERLKITVSILEIIIFSILFLYQKHKKIILVNLSSKGIDLLSIYGLIIAVVSMYGVYLGFLQFIISDFEKTKYLGRNKVDCKSKYTVN